MTDTERLTALVTGASSGIGREIALVFARRGLDLVLASRNENKLAELKDAIGKSYDVAVTVVPVDLAGSGGPVLLYRECEEHGITVDVLVNNAGFGFYGATLAMDDERIVDMIGLNVTALTQLCREFGEGMKERGRGWILNVGSIAGSAPLPYFAVYSATKTYVKNFSRAFREEMKPYGVTVSCLSPGPTKSQFATVAAGGKDVGDRTFMSARAVAEAGVNGLFGGKAHIIPGTGNKIQARIMPLIPVSALGKSMKKSLPIQGE